MKQKQTKLAKFGLTSTKLKEFAETRARMEAEKKAADEAKKAEENKAEQNKTKKLIKKKKESGPSTKGFSLMSGTLKSSEDEQNKEGPKSRSKSPTKEITTKPFAKPEPEIDEKQDLINKMAAGVEFDDDDEFGEAPAKTKKVRVKKQSRQKGKQLKKSRKTHKLKGKQTSPRSKTDETDNCTKDCTNNANTSSQPPDQTDLNDFSAVAERRMWRSLQFALYLAKLGKVKPVRGRALTIWGGRA